VRRFTTAVNAGGKNAGVVEDYKVTGLQQIGELAELAIRPVAAGALQMQHAGGVAGSKGLLGDEFFREVKVEVGDQHGLQL